MTHEMVYFCCPPHWAGIFFDHLDTWVSKKMLRNHGYETDAQAYCASLRLKVQIEYCHAEIDQDRSTLACRFSWETEQDRDVFLWLFLTGGPPPASPKFSVVALSIDSG